VIDDIGGRLVDASELMDLDRIVSVVINLATLATSVSAPR
jgi:hypothetical protein